MVIVGAIKNNSYEHINPDVFIESLQRALTNSGRAIFVANKEERVDVRDERADQQQYRHPQQAQQEVLLAQVVLPMAVA